MCLIVVALAAYLIGSLPTGYLAGKAKGVDIRQAGSGNIGATNALRVCGKKVGALVLAVDALKGYAACALLPLAAEGVWSGAAAHEKWLRIVAGLAAILGHNFTCWLGFKGGKGISTSGGVLLAMAPGAGVIAIIVWSVTTLVSRYASLGSIAAAVSLPLSAWFFMPDPKMVGVLGLMGALAIFQHRGNIRRLRNGEERRIGASRKEEK